MRKFTEWIILNIYLFFFNHWLLLIPENIDFCKKSGLFIYVQRLTLEVLHQSERWELCRLEALSAARLKQLMIHHRAHLESVLGRKLDRESTHDEFFKLPVMRRDDLRTAFAKAIESFQSTTTNHLYIGSTSGSSGLPMRIGVTTKIQGLFRIVRRRMFEFGGLNPEHEFLYPRTKSMPHYCEKNIYMQPSLEALVGSYKIFFKRIKEQNIKALYAFPSFLSLLCDRVEDTHIAPPSNLSIIFSAGENLSKEMREKFKTTFHTKVLNFYASVELSSVAAECDEEDGLHISPEFHYIEILSDDNSPILDGEWGRIVITPLDKHLMPFFRYDTGDIGKLVKKKCSCGRTLPRLYLQGRNLEIIQTPNGVISPHAFKEIIEMCDKKSEKIKQHQIILEGTKKMILIVVPENTLVEEDFTKLKQTCLNFINGKIDFDIQISDDVERVGIKAPYVIRKEVPY